MSFGTIAVSSSDARNIVWQPAWNRQPYNTSDGGRSWASVNLAGASGDTPGSFRDTWLQRKTLTADKTLLGTCYSCRSGGDANVALQGGGLPDNTGSGD